MKKYLAITILILFLAVTIFTSFLKLVSYLFKKIDLDIIFSPKKKG